ncbi:MAG: hypothetical protein KAH10_08725, partial [Flavobacteriales bacterium]|nr:hypothetical protein [Flavobacteriales bacterium]
MKHKIILEIREVASEIEKSDSLNATVLREKVAKLYDKLVVLEFLERGIKELVKEEIFVEKKDDLVNDDANSETTSELPITEDFVEKELVEELSEEQEEIPFVESKVEESKKHHPNLFESAAELEEEREENSIFESSNIEEIQEEDVVAEVVQEISEESNISSFSAE